MWTQHRHPALLPSSCDSVLVNPFSVDIPRSLRRAVRAQLHSPLLRDFFFPTNDICLSSLAFSLLLPLKVRISLRGKGHWSGTRPLVRKFCHFPLRPLPLHGTRYSGRGGDGCRYEPYTGSWPSLPFVTWDQSRASTHSSRIILGLVISTQWLSVPMSSASSIPDSPHPQGPSVMLVSVDPQLWTRFGSFLMGFLSSLTKQSLWLHNHSIVSKYSVAIEETLTGMYSRCQVWVGGYHFYSAMILLAGKTLCVLLFPICSCKMLYVLTPVCLSRPLPFHPPWATCQPELPAFLE